MLACSPLPEPAPPATDNVPARLVSENGDSATLQVPDTVRRGLTFSVTVTGFAGGCILGPAGSRVKVHGLVADVTPFHRRLWPDSCQDHWSQMPQTISLRFDDPGVGRIRFHGATNRLDFGVKPKWVVMERHVVVR